VQVNPPSLVRTENLRNFDHQIKQKKKNTSEILFHDQKVCEMHPLEQKIR